MFDKNYGPCAPATETPDHGQDKNHNFLAACADDIRRHFATAKGSSRATLEELRAVGERLNEVKETLAGTGKGAFGRWCEDMAFPFDASWRARLMKLAANWAEIMAAVDALPDDKKKWSVDGVMAIWAAAKRAAEAPQGDGEEGAGGEGQPKTEKAKRETEAERLRRELAEALERIRSLEAENASLRGEGPKAKAKPKAEEASPGVVSATTKRRAASVYALMTNGSTDGEKASAKSRLEEMASKAGMAFDAFLKACGLKA